MCTWIPVAVSLNRSIRHTLPCTGFVFYSMMYLGDLCRSALGEHSLHIPLSGYWNLSDQSLAIPCSRCQRFAAASNAADQRSFRRRLSVYADLFPKGWILSPRTAQRAGTFLNFNTYCLKAFWGHAYQLTFRATTDLSPGLPTANANCYPLAPSWPCPSGGKRVHCGCNPHSLPLGGELKNISEGHLCLFSGSKAFTSFAYISIR